MTLLIPFARRRSDGRMVDALAVTRGKNCGCECPACEKLVIARHCTMKISHFAHVAMAACEGALESSLHAAAKQAIVELGFVWLPESLAGKTTKFVFARAVVEQARDYIRPDLTLYTKGGKPLAIEVCVTHEIGPEKEEYLQRTKLACVEYHLDALPRDLTYAALKRSFAENEVIGTWAYNEKALVVAEQRRKEAAKRLAQEEAREKAEELRQQAELKAWLRSPHAKARKLPIERIEGHGYINDCPIWRRGSVEKFKGIAFADLDCPECPYCVGRTTALLNCIGHFPQLALMDDQIVHRFGGNITKRTPLWLDTSMEAIAFDRDDPF